MIPNWLKFVLGGVASFFVISRGGVPLLATLIKLLLPIIVIYFATKKLKNLIASGASGKKSMPRGEREKEGFSSGGVNQHQETIEICPECGSQIEPGHSKRCVQNRS